MGLKLALIGSIKDEIMNIEELSLELIKMLQERYPGVLEKYYEAGIEETDSALVILEKIARARGCIKAGAELDYLKAANLILENYRNGKIGKISLEGPNG